MKTQDREPLLSLEEQLAALSAEVPPVPADFHARWMGNVRQEAGREALRNHTENARVNGLRDSVGREVMPDQPENARTDGLSESVGGEGRKAPEIHDMATEREAGKTQRLEPVAPGRWRKLAGIAAALIVLVGGAAVFRAQRPQLVSMKLEARIPEPEETEEAAEAEVAEETEGTGEAADQYVFQADMPETETDGAVFAETSTAAPTPLATIMPDAIARGGISNVMETGKKSAEKAAGQASEEAVEQPAEEAAEAADAGESGALPETAASGASEQFAEAADRMEETEEAEEDAAFMEVGAEEMSDAAESESMAETGTLEEPVETAESEAAEESPDTETAEAKANEAEDNRRSWLWAAAFLAFAIGCGLLERHRKKRK